jgi:hypothetical protein
MKPTHVEHRLRVKEHELLSSVEASLGDISSVWLQERLTEVREALNRLQAGDYGKCILCSGPIESDRLKAMPWTPYCQEDQRKLDSKKDPGSQKPDQLAQQQSA